MNQSIKTLMTFLTLSVGLIVSLFAQANIAVPPLPPEGQSDIFTAMYNTILHNPSSLFVVLGLSIVAWLMDELPFINSRFVTHFTTLIGGATYWMFCHPGNVPKSFPYAWPVLACIGGMCGFFAGILHKIVIGRLIEWVKSKIPGTDPKPADKPSVPPVALWLLAGLAAVLITGCNLGKRLEPGGFYAASETQAARPELYALDASFDVTYSALDTVFKYERGNRQLLWKLSPNIKHTLDKLRTEAGKVVKDYATARQTYLAVPTPAGMTELETSLSRLKNLNASALAVIQTKGNP